MSKSGFTLIELMIVVAIIGILAAIAIPNFINFQMKAKTAEAKSNLGCIRTCLEAYMAEFDRYISAAYHPAGSPTNTKRAWGNGNDGFNELGFTPIADFVYYSYAISTPGGNNQTYSAEAYGDLDGNGQKSTWRTMNNNSNITRIGTEKF